MKGITDEPEYSVGLLDGGTALCDVINHHIEEETLVGALHGFLKCLLDRFAAIAVFRFIVYMVVQGGMKAPFFFRWLMYFQCQSYFPSYFLQSEKNAFFVADLGVIIRQHVRWRTRMPQIRPYYAVRCNSSPAVIEVLAALGSGFTCSNKVSFTTYKSSVVIRFGTDVKCCVSAECWADGIASFIATPVSSTFTCLDPQND